MYSIYPFISLLPRYLPPMPLPVVYISPSSSILFSFFHRPPLDLIARHIVSISSLSYLDTFTSPHCWAYKKYLEIAQTCSLYIALIITLLSTLTHSFTTPSTPAPLLLVESAQGRRSGMDWEWHHRPVSRRRRRFEVDRRSIEPNWRHDQRWVWPEWAWSM